MGTSAVLNGVEQPKREFPLVAKSNLESDGKLIVLFDSEKSGTVIVSGLKEGILGQYSKTWTNCFDNYTWQILDSVTITFKS